MERPSYARLRAVSLLLLGALAVHWLRYWLAYGEAADHQLHLQGHGYLSDLLPGVVALSVAMAVASLALRVLRGDASELRPGRQRAWLVFTVALLAIYGAQELSEGFLAAGHHSGLAALTADGGWVAAPLACLVGGVLTLLASLLERAEHRVARLLSRPIERHGSTASPPAPDAPFVVRMRQGSLAFGFARRPPPLFLSS